METIQSYLSRLPNTFNEQRPIVKVLIGCSSIYIICLCLSISAAILLPSKPTPVLSPTPAVVQPTVALIGSSLPVEKSANSLNPSITTVPLTIKPSHITQPGQISAKIVPNPAPHMNIPISPIDKIP